MNEELYKLLASAIITRRDAEKIETLFTRERAEAWDEGVKAATNFVGDNAYVIQDFATVGTSALDLATWLLQNTQPPNPYRTAVTK